MTTLPRDTDNTPIPALRLRPGGAYTLAATTASSVRNANAFDAQTRLVGIYATGPVYIAFGDSSVTAGTDDHFFPSGLYFDFAVGGGKTLHTPYMAVRAVDGDCTVYISEKN